MADKLIELIETDCNSICPPGQRADAIAALEREIDQLVRLDVALTDQAGDGAVHDEATPAPAFAHGDGAGARPLGGDLNRAGDGAVMCRAPAHLSA